MSRKTSILVTCDTCGQAFERKPSKVSRNNYCSQACKAIGMTRLAQQRVEQRHGAPIHDLLDRLYNVERLGVKEVARRLGISDRICWDWMNALGIERRGRSEAVRLQWQGNPLRREEQRRRIIDDFVAGRRDHLTIRETARTDSSRRRNSESKRGEKNPMFGRRGPLHPLWKGGHIPIEEYGPQWRSIRAKVRARDGHRCQSCGSTANLQVHHIQPFRNQRRHDLADLITLCASCHTKVERGTLECPRPKA
jgi:5-methylcytosine-specific restriction endonuclease McrA/endogenous inhibitor of DNA gyrase (YacG/DUF329 family)